MSGTEHRPASLRLSELLVKVSTSEAIQRSALEVLRVLNSIKMLVLRDHMSGVSGVRELLSQYEVLKPFDLEKAFPGIAQALADQSAANIEKVISSAVIILSHSLADDIFSEACSLAIDIDPKKWISQISTQREVSLQALQVKGVDGVIADELKSLKIQLAAKSLPNRADILFTNVPIRRHPDIPKDDPRYFKGATLKQADDLRHGLIHRNGVAQIDPASGPEFMGFLHEAAHTALRSIGFAYRISIDAEFFKALGEKRTEESKNS